MPIIRILHNPRCSKSRQTLQLLRDNGIEPQIIEYLKTPLSASELSDVFKKLPIDNIEQMMRLKEAEFRSAGLTKGQVTVEQGLSAMAEYPKLMERPIVITDNDARLGRPPESVLELLS